MQETLLILVKNPVEGHAKTRLAKEIGHPMAIEVYRRLLACTHRAVAPLTCKKVVWYGDFIPPHDLWDGYEKRLQAGNGLGERMLGAFEAAFAAGSHKVVVIGSDCPAIEPRHLAAAFEALDAHDSVLGPALDGGYYLLGMKRLMPVFFENIPWSTETVLACSLQAAAQIGASCTLLEPLSDIDTAQDLWPFIAQLDLAHAFAPIP